MNHFNIKMHAKDKEEESFPDTVPTNSSYILAAGLYYYLASTLQYLKNIYQKKMEECCTMFTLYSLIISHPSKEQNTILNVARQQFFIIHRVVRPISLQTKQPQ